MEQFEDSFSPFGADCFPISIFQPTECTKMKLTDLKSKTTSNILEIQKYQSARKTRKVQICWICDTSVLTHHSVTTDSCCVSIQGPHPSKDPAFVVFEGESFGETMLTSSSISWLRHHFTLTSWFLPPRPVKVTIYATQCRHFLSFFLLFSGMLRILGYRRPRRIVVVHPPKWGKRRSICVLHLEEPSHGIVT